MQVEDAADGPASSYLLKPSVRAAEDGRLPQSIELEGLAYVVIRPCAREGWVIGVGILIVGTGAGVDALSPCVFGVCQESVGELVLDACEQGVIAGGSVVVEPVEAVDLRIEGNACYCSE